MPQGQLAQVLRGFEVAADDRLIVGPSTMDDAGVVVLGEGEGLPAGVKLALVQTIDFFPPVVDDPRAYGAIAAANAVSDVYAMGGRPVSALTLASFPKEFPHEWMVEIHCGGFDKLREAACVVAGGHTVQGAVQFGFAVTGVVDPARMTANSGARAGDVAYLTKPLGMGTLTTAAKSGKVDASAVEPAVRQMATLNRAAAEAMVAAGAHACTDVTGFGIVGHGRNVARASGLTFELDSARVPLFPGVLELSRRGLNSGGAKRGREALADEVEIASGLDDALVRLLFDAETSGGLLIAVAPGDAGRLERELAARSVSFARVGSFEKARGPSVAIR